MAPIQNKNQIKNTNDRNESKTVILNSFRELIFQHKTFSIHIDFYLNLFLVFTVAPTDLLLFPPSCDVLTAVRQPKGDKQISYKNAVICWPKIVCSDDRYRSKHIPSQNCWIRIRFVIDFVLNFILKFYNVNDFCEYESFFFLIFNPR